MSEKIPTLGKIWLILMTVLSAIGTVTNLLAVGSGLIYLVSALACAAEFVGLVYLLQGKGFPFLCVYSGGYLVNAILVALINNNISAAWLVGFVFGVCLNIGLTYLSAKNTIEFKK